MEKIKLGQKITESRKNRKLTQNELAEKLFVTYQAVSQWENDNTYPDISLLPELCKILNISLNELFGINEEECMSEDTLYIKIYRGNKEIKNAQIIEKENNITIDLEGDVLNVESTLSLSIDGEIKGDVKAGCNINCDNIGGNATAGCDINCDDIDGNGISGQDINCDNINGNAISERNINCDEILGNIITK